MAFSRVGVYGADRGGIVSFHSVLYYVGTGSREERKKSCGRGGGGSGGDGVGRRYVGVEQDGKVAVVSFVTDADASRVPP